MSLEVAKTAAWCKIDFKWDMRDFTYDFPIYLMVYIKCIKTLYNGY